MLMAVLTPGETLKERGAEEEQESQENDIITSHQEMNEEDEKGDLAVKKENSEEEKEGDGTLDQSIFKSFKPREPSL